MENMNVEMIKGFYSYLSALIGSNDAAFLAGYHPKKMPVAAQTTNESATACKLAT